MELKPLKANKRELSSKSAVKNLRREGKAPAVYYGNGVETLSLDIDVREFKTIYGPGTRNSLIDLQIDGQATPAIVYGIQKHAISRDVLHVDFKAIKADEKVTVNVAVNLKGDAIGVKNEGGMLVKLVNALRVSCFPSDIPANFEIDISECPSDFTFYAEKLELPENVELVSNLRTVIFAIQKGRGKK